MTMGDAPEAADATEPVANAPEISGFRAAPASAVESGDDTARLSAIAAELNARAERFAQSVDESLVLAADGAIRWLGDVVGKIAAGEAILEPKAILLADDALAGELRESAEKRLSLWLSAHIKRLLGALVEAPSSPPSTDAAREIYDALVRSLGILDRRSVKNQVRTLDQTARAELRKLGVRFGAFYIFFPALLKPANRALAAQLWHLRRAGAALDASADKLPNFALAGRTSFPADPALGSETYRVAGFRLSGDRALRIDIAERLNDLIRAGLASSKLPGVDGSAAPVPYFVVTGQMTSLAGCSGENFATLLRSFGFEPTMAAKPMEPAASAPIVPEAQVSPEAVADEAPDAEPAGEAQLPFETLLPQKDDPQPAVVVESLVVQAIDESQNEAQPEAPATTDFVGEAPGEEVAEAASAPPEDAQGPQMIEIWRVAPRPARAAQPAHRRQARTETRQKGPPAERRRDERPGRTEGPAVVAPEVRASAATEQNSLEAGPAERGEGGRSRNDPRKANRQWPRPSGRSESKPRDAAPPADPVAPRRRAQPDPDSPFAKLADLRALLESQSRRGR